MNLSFGEVDPQAHVYSKAHNSLTSSSVERGPCGCKQRADTLQETRLEPSSGFVLLSPNSGGTFTAMLAYAFGSGYIFCAGHIIIVGAVALRQQGINWRLEPDKS